jgi:TonB family protein
MGIRHNVIISLFFHAIMITALFSVNYRERVFPLPTGYVEVSLLEELSENRFSVITQNYSNRLHHPEHSEVSKKQYPLLSVRSVPGEETLRLHIGMAGYNGLASGEEMKIKEKSKSEIVLFREEIVNKNYGEFFNETERSTEKDTDDYGVASTGASEGIKIGQSVESFAVRGQNKDSDNSSTIEAIRSAIERAKNYPILARKRGIEGTVIVSFRIDARGSPQDVKIVRSSGYQILDEEVPKMLRKASPFPELSGDIVIPVIFRLKESISDR